MKVYQDVKSKEYFPEKLVHARKSCYEVFIEGTGIKKYKLSQLILIEIEDLPEEYTEHQFINYAKKYGKECAKEFMACCDTSKEPLLNAYLDKNFPNDEVCKWFNETFKVSPMEFRTYLLSVFNGVYFFNLPEFELFLTRFGYKIDEDGSIKDFLIQKFGKENAKIFEDNFINKKHEY